MTKRERVSDDDLTIFCDGTMDWRVVFQSGKGDDSGRMTVFANELFCDLRDERTAHKSCRVERDELREAVGALLQFIREKYPQDFVNGKQGFACPHHQRLYELTKQRTGSDETTRQVVD